ncbi:hypothetical protein PQX77_013185 [Marasmius sp. AFHP31]|nr:hypothetical protein PQX77_013185 [Marasmius sp. AFHP31]
MSRSPSISPTLTSKERAQRFDEDANSHVGVKSVGGVDGGAALQSKKTKKQLTSFLWVLYLNQSNGSPYPDFSHIPTKPDSSSTHEC